MQQPHYYHQSEDDHNAPRVSCNAQSSKFKADAGGISSGSCHQLAVQRPGSSWIRGFPAQVQLVVASVVSHSLDACLRHLHQAAVIMSGFL
mmetsp:Transcript_77520/g.128487  ORF Transcript_77520/g.128487 Transcript_77520/m.128487 type:complete len:91 (+) Transcript_77520:1755-2027(+)